MSHLPEGMSGWRGGRSEGAQSRPQSIFEKRTNPPLSDPTTFRSRGTSKGWEDRGSILRYANNGWASTSPNKLDGLCDPWVQAVVNGTTQCSRFQQFSLRMICWKWNGDFRFKCHNPSGRIGAHFFGRLDLHAFKVDRVSLCGNSHNRSHARRQSSRD